MESIYITFTTIIFGWLLGLLSSPIISRIMRYYRRNDLLIVICCELKNLAFRLAGTCFRIEMHLGTSDPKTFKWMKEIIGEYKDDSFHDLSKQINQLTYEKYKDLVASTKASDGKYLAVKTFSLSFTESILGDLSVFKPKLQKEILWIRDRISILNEEISHSAFQSNLTFNTEAMDTNAKIIKQNIDSSYVRIGEQCKDIVVQIECILKCYSRS